MATMKFRLEIEVYKAEGPNADVNEVADAIASELDGVEAEVDVDGKDEPAIYVVNVARVV